MPNGTKAVITALNAILLGAPGAAAIFISTQCTDSLLRFRKRYHIEEAHKWLQFSSFIYRRYSTRCDCVSRVQSCILLSTDRQTMQRKQTPVGLEAQAIMAMGGFVSDETVVKLATSSYKSILDVSNKPPRVLFDGFPRTMWQAQALDNMKPPLNVHLALYIDVPDVTIINRLSGRWVHAASGRTYASDYNPPKKVARIHTHFSFWVFFSF